MEGLDYTEVLNTIIKMCKKIKVFIFFICISLFFINCRNKNKAYDTPLNGKIYISVDESFKPVISEQIKIYHATYPKTQIIASYKSEAACFRDLQSDSTRMIIVSRGLTDDESNYYKQTLSFKPRWDVLAYDAIDVIVNIHAKDSIFTLQQLKSYLKGDDTTKVVVLDGKNATSTVRVLKDSLLNGKNFGNNVFAAGSSKGVIDYISANPNAIGFVGSSWVGDLDDPEQLGYATKIRFALVECIRCEKGMFAKPSQATITNGDYPLFRPLYYILKENVSGLGTGFVNYLVLERGQLVFRRSYLVPAQIDFSVRRSIMETNKNLLNKQKQ
jgi:ABC-type phosphate transport system substrate-binding protein